MCNRRQRAGKEKVLPQLLGSNADPDSNTVQQFELELQWCIQQLERALASKKMAHKHAQDGAHSLAILKSKNAPVIKKRQMMRSLFGDYRIKMAEEERKLSKAHERISIAVPNKKSCFIKQSAVVCEPSQNNFRFNFKVPLSKEKASTQSKANNGNFIYRSSDNNFRFNFAHPAS